MSGLGKALQRKGHLVEIILPKYDCMEHDLITDLKVYYLLVTLYCFYLLGKRAVSSTKFSVWLMLQALDVVVQSYFDGRTFKNKIWIGTIEGLKLD